MARLNASSGKTVFITGLSRGIGHDIALRCARDGAYIVATVTRCGCLAALYTDFFLE